MTQERLPSSSSERLKVKDFSEKLGEFQFDLKKAKEAIYGGSLTKSGGYKLTKGEALMRTGKISTTDEVENAAAYALEAKDIEGFLDKYGGDKYVKRLFEYGLNKMKRDILDARVRFEKDKQKGGDYERLRQYATFDEAFEAGAYKDLVLTFDAVMEKGLSVSEYRQRNERLQKLRYKAKLYEEGRERSEHGKEDKKAGGESGGQGKEGDVSHDGILEEFSFEEKRVNPPVITRGGKKPDGGTDDAKEREIEEKLKAKQERHREKMEKFAVVVRKYRKANEVLQDLGTEFVDSEALLSDVMSKYGNSDDENIASMFNDFRGYKAKGRDGFLNGIVVEGSDISVAFHGKNFSGLMDNGGISLKEETVSNLLGQYTEFVEDHIEKLERLERALYTLADGFSDPRGTADPEQRRIDVSAAEAKIPETKKFSGVISGLKGKLAKFRLLARDIFAKEVPVA